MVGGRGGSGLQVGVNSSLLSVWEFSWRFGIIPGDRYGEEIQI